MSMKNKTEIVVTSVFESAQKALSNTQAHIDIANFQNIVEVIVNTKGKVCFVGVGKSGLIGRKVAATFASVGQPAVFINAAEAMHGDLGIIQEDDCVVMLSQSGATEEVVVLLPHIRERGVPLIAVTGKLDSKLAEQADLVLDSSVEQESCPLGAAPTTSVTVALVLLHAVAVACMNETDFAQKDFARNHPGGSLGKKLFVSVGSIARTEDLPVVKAGDSLQETISVMNEGALGHAFVLDDEGGLQAIFTDGDLRRALSSGKVDVSHMQVGDYASKDFVSVGPGCLASDAWLLIEENQISLLPVLQDGYLVGAVHAKELRHYLT